MKRIISQLLDAPSNLALSLTCHHFHDFLGNLRKGLTADRVLPACGRYGDPKLLVWIANYFSPSRPRYYIPEEEPVSFFTTLFRVRSIAEHVDNSNTLLLHFGKKNKFMESLIEEAMATNQKEFIKWVDRKLKPTWTGSMVGSCMTGCDPQFTEWALGKIMVNDQIKLDMRYSLLMSVVSHGNIDAFDLLVDRYQYSYTFNQRFESDLLVSAAARGGKMNQGKTMPMMNRLMDGLAITVIPFRAVGIRAIKGGNLDTLQFAVEQGNILNHWNSNMDYIKEAIKSKNSDLLKYILGKYFELHPQEISQQKEALFKVARQFNPSSLELLTQFQFSDCTNINRLIGTK